MSLQAQIEKFKKEMSGQIPPEVQQVMQQAGEELERSRISSHSLKAGDAAPDLNCRCRQRT